MNFLKEKFFSFWYIYSMRSGAVMIQPAATMVKIFPRKNVIFWWPTIASGSWCTNGHLQILSFSFRPKILSIGFKSKKFYIKIKPLDEVCCRVASLVQCIPNYIFTCTVYCHWVHDDIADQQNVGRPCYLQPFPTQRLSLDGENRLVLDRVK